MKSHFSPDSLERKASGALRETETARKRRVDELDVDVLRRTDARVVIFQQPGVCCTSFNQSNHSGSSSLMAARFRAALHKLDYRCQTHICPVASRWLQRFNQLKRLPVRNQSWRTDISEFYYTICLQLNRLCFSDALANLEFIFISVVKGQTEQLLLANSITLLISCDIWKYVKMAFYFVLYCLTLAG